MGHIVKSIIRIIAFFIVAVPIYYVCDLDSESTIYSAGIIATILSVTIGSSLTIMALNFSMIPKAIEKIEQLNGESSKKEQAIDALKRSVREVKEDSILILIAGMMIIPLMAFKKTSFSVQFWGNTVLFSDIICLAILGLLCNIAIAFFDCVLTFLRSFNMVLISKNT